MSESNLKYFTTYNFAEKDFMHENEDAYKHTVTDDMIRFALSDGAGGIGVFNGEWARFLVDNQPIANYIEEDWQQWLSATSEQFYEHIAPDQTIADSLVLQKFYAVGSFATLLYTWIDLTNNLILSQGIGDTCLFHLRKETMENYKLIKIFPINSYNSITDFPKLLNWNIQHYNWSNTYQSTLQKGDVIICCTDGMARFFIKMLLQGDNAVFDDHLLPCFLESLRSEPEKISGNSVHGLMRMIENFLSLEGEDEKIATLQTWIDQGMEIDDFTISRYIHD